MDSIYGKTTSFEIIIIRYDGLDLFLFLIINFNIPLMLYRH